MSKLIQTSTEVTLGVLNQIKPKERDDTSGSSTSIINPLPTQNLFRDGPALTRTSSPTSSPISSSKRAASAPPVRRSYVKQEPSMESAQKALREHLVSLRNQSLNTNIDNKLMDILQKNNGGSRQYRRGSDFGRLGMRALLQKATNHAHPNAHPGLSSNLSGQRAVSTPTQK